MASGLLPSSNERHGASVNEQPANSLPSVFEDGDAYDLVLRDIPYGLDFYVALAREANGPVLDIACGTGRILLPCLQAGVDIEGLDLFEPMLKTLRAKAAALGLSPRLHQADMSDFSLPRRYALVMIPFNAFIHNMTQEAQIRCLQLCREHCCPAASWRSIRSFRRWRLLARRRTRACWKGSCRIRRTGLPMRMYDTRSFDRVAQTQHSLNEIELLAADGSVQTVLSLRSQLAVYLQARNGAAAARRRLRAMGNLRRLRPPPADARERRDDRDGLERVNRQSDLVLESQKTTHLETVWLGVPKAPQ